MSQKLIILMSQDFNFGRFLWGDSVDEKILYAELKLDHSDAPKNHKKMLDLFCRGAVVKT